MPPGISLNLPLFTDIHCIADHANTHASAHRNQWGHHYKFVSPQALGLSREHNAETKGDHSSWWLAAEALTVVWRVLLSSSNFVPASSCIIGWTCWWKKMANNITRPSTCCFFWPTIAIFLGQHTIPIIIPMGGKPNWKCACVHRGRWCHLRSEPPSPPSPTRLICLVALDHLWVISILRWQVKSFRWIICHVLVRFLRIDAWEIYPAYLFFSKFLHVLSESIGK